MRAAAEAGGGDAGGVRRVQLLPGLTAVVLTVLLLWLVARVAQLLLLFFIAALIAIYLDSLAAFLGRKLKLKSRVAFILAFVVTLAAIAGIGALLVPPLVDQTRQLIAKLPDYAAVWKDRLGRLLDGFPELQALVTPDKQMQFVSGALQQVQGVVGNLLPHVFNAVTGFIDIASALAIGLYLATHPAVYRELVISLMPPRHRDATREVLHALAETLRSWVLAQLLMMAVLGALMTIGLSLLGVPYALTFGIFSGLAAIVPFFGTLISTILPALFVLGGAGGIGGALLVLLLGVAIHLIEGNVIEPLIMARGVDLPPVLSIMAVLVAGHLLGPIGLLTAVPALCVVMVLVRRVLVERVYGDTVSGAEQTAAAPAPAAAGGGEAPGA